MPLKQFRYGYVKITLIDIYNKAMDKKFKLGDIVVMVTGGPKMAIEGYLTDEETAEKSIEKSDLVNAVYFANDSFKRITINQDLLLFA